MDTQTQHDITVGFLAGMYYAGQLPARAESYQIARYLRSRHLIVGPLIEVEKLVIKAMTALHQAQEDQDMPNHDRSDGLGTG